ncbi:MAG TPA: hypothetical protein VFM05_06675, partial [Candidatus Saccharimonadales bacterium]|nr:hypothetical protein [Candidatus Saccharimonadales bacterium]
SKEILERDEFQTLGTTHTNRSSIHGYWTSRVAAQSRDRAAQAAVLYSSNEPTLLSGQPHTETGGQCESH